MISGNPLEAKIGLRQNKEKAMPNSMAKGPVWDLSAGKFQAGTSKLYNRLGERGAQVITQLDEDSDFCDRVARLMIDGAHRVHPTNWDLALEIMGEENVFLPIDWTRFYGYALTDDQLRESSEIPWTKETLKRLKRDFFLFYAMPVCPDGSPLTVSRSFFLADHKICFGPWIGEQSISAIRQDVLSGWQLVRKEILPRSTKKDYDEQLKLLNPNEVPPSALQETMKSALIFKKRGVWVNRIAASRTRDLFLFQGEPRPSRSVTVGRERHGTSDHWVAVVWWADLRQLCSPTDQYVRRLDLGMGSAIKQEI